MKFDNRNAVVHGHFSLASLYSSFEWPNNSVDRSILFGTEMRNFYNDISIDDCFEYLYDIFDKDKKNYFFVHTFTIDSLINKKYNFNNKEIRIVNLIRNPEDVLNSSLNLAQNGYKNSIIMKKHITRSYGNILKKINSPSIRYIDYLSKSIGVEETMLILFAVDSVKIMLDDSIVGEKLGVESYYIEDLTNNSKITKKFLESYISINQSIKKINIASFQTTLKHKENKHGKNTRHSLFDYAENLLEKVLNAKSRDYKTIITENINDGNITNIQNISTDFYSQLEDNDLSIKKEVLQVLHQIITEGSNTEGSNTEGSNQKKELGSKKLLIRLVNIYKNNGLFGILKKIKNKLFH